MTKTKCIAILLPFFFFANAVFADSSNLSNAGFVKSGIWFSEDPFYAGEKVRIYTIVFNGSEFDLLGDVNFEDNGSVICKGSFSAAAGRTHELWCDWDAVVGNHKISASIVNAKVAPIGEAPRQVVLENSTGGVVERKVSLPPVKSAPVTPSVVSVGGATATPANAGYVEKKIMDGLSSFQENIKAIAPTEIKKEDIDGTKEKVLSFIPVSVVESIGKLAAKTGIDKLADPISYVVDFFVVAYKLIIGDPLLLVVIASLIIWFSAKYFYRNFFSK